MLKNSTFAAVFSTAYLILLVILVLVGYADAAPQLLLFSPPLVAWLVYTVLHFGEVARRRALDEYFYNEANT